MQGKRKKNQADAHFFLGQKNKKLDQKPKDPLSVLGAGISPVDSRFNRQDRREPPPPLPLHNPADVRESGQKSLIAPLQLPQIPWA